MNKIRTVSIFFLFLILDKTGIAQNNPNATKLTLKQCIETGLANNLDVLQGELQMQSSKINMNQSKLNLLPDLNGSASHNFRQGRSIDPYSNSPVTEGVNSSNFSLSSGVVLFNGLSRQNAIKQFSLAYQASKMDWQQVKDNLTINIILAYLQVLSNEDQLEQSKSRVVLSNKQVERLNIMNQEGAIRPSDLSDLKGQYAGDQLSIVNAQYSLETSRIALCQFLNIPYSKDLSLERIEQGSLAVKYEETPDKIYQTALEQFALIKAVDLRRQSSEKAVKVARGQLFPTLSFGGAVATNYSSIAEQRQFINTTFDTTTSAVFVNNLKYPVYTFQSHFTDFTKIGYNEQLKNNISTFYGFSLTVPIFNNFLQRNRIKQAKIILKNNELVAKTTKTQLQQSIEQAYINMTSASDRYKILLEQLTAYTESFRAAEIRFNEGLGTSIDYLTAKNNLDRTNIDVIAAKYDYVLRTKVLDYYQGKQLW
jgi:outer membrane protein